MDITLAHLAIHVLEIEAAHNAGGQRVIHVNSHHGVGFHSRHGWVVDLGCELLDTVDALRRADAELGQMRSQGI